MKRIDLHIHTVATQSDSKFTFSLETFVKYVTTAKLDAVAVTNHNLFDLEQFLQIQHALPTKVFAGIEIDVENGHVLVISDTKDLDQFATRAMAVQSRIKTPNDSMQLHELLSIYPDLNKYVVIPHTDKNPKMSATGLNYFSTLGAPGEVDSQKKFVRALKDPYKATPVLFSDARMSDGLSNFPSRHTFLDCGEISVPSLKECLRHKSKVALSEHDGHSLWQALPTGQMLSTGLNVLIGGRSTGKTHTLDQISSTQDRPKYIKQFSLVQRSEEDHKRDFEASIEKERSSLISDHFLDFKSVVDDVIKVDLSADDRSIQEYITSLLKSAEESGRQDAYSKVALFGETEFPINETKELGALIDSVRNVIENEAYRTVIEKHIDRSALKRLAFDLIAALRDADLLIKKKEFVNRATAEVKQLLQVKTSATQVKNVDLYHVTLNKKRVERFREIANFLRTQTIIFQDTIQGYRIEARREAFSTTSEVKRASGTALSFRECFAKYRDAYDYLRSLDELEGLPKDLIHKLFAKISYRVLNRDGFEVSGGERSEFRLLQEIKDAQNYEILLIDEPESSFDNLFLKGDLNKLIKDIANTMPVVVVTHNSTVGASIGADYVLYTSKSANNGSIEYRVYGGRPSDTSLKSADGSSIPTHSVLMNSLEGGVDAYEGRMKSYEAVKD